MWILDGRRRDRDGEERVEGGVKGGEEGEEERGDTEEAKLMKTVEGEERRTTRGMEKERGKAREI